MFIGAPSSKVVQIFSQSVEKHGRQGAKLVFLIYVLCKIFKNLFVKKYLPDLKIIWHNCSVGNLLPKLIWSIEKHGRQGLVLFSLYVHCKIFKNLLGQKYWPDLKIIWHKCSLGDLLPRLFKLIRSIEKHGRQGRGLFSLYVHCKIFKNLLVQKHLPDLKFIWHRCSLGDLLPRLFK